MKTVVLLVLVLITHNKSVFGLFCYWNSGCPYSYFSSETSYSSVRGDIRDSLIKIKDCEPISIWGLIRHGKRYPSKQNNVADFNIGIRDYIVSSFKNGNSSLCAQDVENLRDWPIDENILERSGGVTEEGLQDSQGIAYRLKHAFPNLFDILIKGNYVLQSDSTKSTIDSAKAFIKGLGMANIELDKSLRIETQFDWISPYSKCKKRQISGAEEMNHEASKYLKSTDFLVMKDRIQRRTGVSFALTNEDILSLYDLCRYSSSSSKTLSPWCAVFTTEDLKVLEYYHDLKHYYKSGYGYPDIDKFGSFALVDLLKSFAAAKDEKGKNIILYFINSSALDIVNTALGLYKDENSITAAHRNPERNWMSSKIVPFSANLLAVLNKCAKNNTLDYNVMFFSNEHVLGKICKGGICSWNDFENKMSPFQDITANFDEYKIQLCDQS